MKRRKSLFLSMLVLTVLLGLPGRLVVAIPLPSQGKIGTSNVCPPVQNTPFFTIAYGTVTLDGQDAPVGTTVETRSPRGDVTGCFEVTTGGNYGMMYIYGEDTTVTPPIPGMRAGETATFYVNGSSATAAPTLTWADDKSWHQVELVAINVANAEFSGTPLQGIAPLTVGFTNLSTGDFTTCVWAFGDSGTSSSCDNPSHTYTNPGVYNVSLIVSGTLGSNIETKTDYITVNTPVSAEFSATPTVGVVPLLVTFTNLSTGDFSNSLWSFGDGITSTTQHPTHTYTITGIYTVSLTIQGTAGEYTRTRVNFIMVEEEYEVFLPLAIRGN